MDEHSEHFNKEIKNTRKVPNRNYKAEGYNNWTENTAEKRIKEKAV